jgi:cytochrome c-type biogenesis protein CcmH
MTPEQRQAMIRSMVEGLAQRLETNPADIEGWRRLARAWGVLEETEKAREAWRRAAEVAPERVDVLLDYARALFPPGGAIERPPETFIALMRRINALDANVPEPLFWLGIDAANRGDTAEARAKWTALLARVPGDSPVAVELKRRLEALPR